VTAGPTNLNAQRLRLVGAEERSASPSAARASRREVARENRSAAMGADDVRVAFAAQAAGALEGGRAAILRPQARRELLSAADHLGLRPFDANLIIAVVQEQARRGESAGSDDVRATLSLFSTRRGDDGSRGWLWAGAFVGGLVAFAALAAWVAGG
jgi:hypothetical protein